MAKPEAKLAPWLSRTVGVVMLGEQSTSHFLRGEGSDLLILGVGLFLLAGKEGVEFLRLVLGRDGGSSSGPPRQGPDS